MKRTALALLSSLFILNAAGAANAFKLPDTGQTTCYNASGTIIPCAGTGQDGAYSTNPMSFTDNVDGTITDNNTGLIWQKCSMGQANDASCSGTTTAYNWYQASGTYDATYNATTENLCGYLALAGGGWRLPTKKEMINIVDYSITVPWTALVQTYFPSTAVDYYWSSTTRADNTDHAWLVAFFRGDAYPSPKDGNRSVRCVRGGM